jgi:hypothetical protein
VTTWEPLQGGKHVWTVHVRSACDLVWLGVSDGTLEVNVWVSLVVDGRGLGRRKGHRGMNGGQTYPHTRRAGVLSMQPCHAPLLPGLSFARASDAAVAPTRPTASLQGGKQAGGWLYGSNDALCRCEMPPSLSPTPPPHDSPGALPRPTPGPPASAPDSRRRTLHPVRRSLALITPLPPPAATA